MQRNNLAKYFNWGQIPIKFFTISSIYNWGQITFFDDVAVMNR